MLLMYIFTYLCACFDFFLKKNMDKRIGFGTRTFVVQSVVIYACYKF
jgi:hypothetical protein